MEASGGYEKDVLFSLLTEGLPAAVVNAAFDNLFRRKIKIGRLQHQHPSMVSSPARDLRFFLTLSRPPANSTS